MAAVKPFRVLRLPSVAQDVVFSLMEIIEIYQLSKCSTKSRNAVKLFTPRQNYSFEIDVKKSKYRLKVWSYGNRKRFSHELRSMDNTDRVYDDVPTLLTYREDYSTPTKQEIVYFLNVFTEKVSILRLEDATKVIDITQFLKTATRFPVQWVCHSDTEVTDDNVYKYVLKEFKHITKLRVRAIPSIDFQFDDMEPFTSDVLWIWHADWVTVDHLVRCFINLKEIRLTFNSERARIVPELMHQFFNAWQQGSRIEMLELECDWSNVDLRAMFQNVPTTEVKRVAMGYEKKIFADGECFLLCQESGKEAIVYCGRTDLFRKNMLRLTTGFRLLRDDEKDQDSFDEFEDEEEESENDESDESSEDESSADDEEVEEEEEEEEEEEGDVFFNEHSF